MPPPHITQAKTVAAINSGTRCATQRTTEEDGSRVFAAALIQAIPGVKLAFDPRATAVASRPHGNWSTFANSARYRVLQYLAACIRLSHNFFTYDLPLGGAQPVENAPPARQAWVSIDNDRCFADHVRAGRMPTRLFMCTCTPL